MSIEDEVRAAALDIRGKYRICVGGAWAEWSGDKLLAVDPVAALIMRTGGYKKPENLSYPGYIERAKILGMSRFWLYRFFMGYDRNYQIMVDQGDGKNYSKDGVSEFGIRLRKELFG